MNISTLRSQAGLKAKRLGVCQSFARFREKIARGAAGATQAPIFRFATLPLTTPHLPPRGTRSTHLDVPDAMTGRS